MVIDLTDSFDVFNIWWLNYLLPSGHMNLIEGTKDVHMRSRTVYEDLVQFRSYIHWINDEKFERATLTIMSTTLIAVYSYIYYLSIPWCLNVLVVG